MVSGDGAVFPRVLLPYEPELDYTTFAVVLEFDELPTLPARLAAMGAEELRAKREVLRDIHRDFVWDDGYGRAYEAVRDAVLAKVRSAARR